MIFGKPPKIAALRWTINRACIEFGVQHKALQKALLRNDSQPGPDDCYTTRQIAAAIYGDKEKAAIKKLEAEARTAERRDAEAEKKVISVEAAARINASIAIPIRQMIITSSIPQAERLEILDQITRLEHADFTKPS